MKLYLIAGLLAVLVVSGLSMDATLEREIPALLKLTNDVSGEAKRDDAGGDILHHIYCLELHKAGYCKYDLIRNKFCKKICACSDGLDQGCCKTLKDKKECGSGWGLNYCYATCNKCFLCSIKPLGMQSRAIPDARITASSMWDGNHAPAQGRLNYKPPRGKAGSWSSKHNRVGQWIQVDLNRVTKVTGIATQGRSDTNQWVVETFEEEHELIYELHNKMKLYLIAGLLAVLVVVPGLSMDATLDNEIPALLESTNDFSAEDEITALLEFTTMFQKTGKGNASEEAKRGGGDVLHHLHCLELHKAGYCKYGLIRNRFCKKTCSCSDVLAQGCCKTLKDKNECASAWGMKYCHETCHKCFLCNIEPLGMQSKAIPDARITASSMWDGNHAPAQGRLNYKPPRGKAGSWSSRHNRVGLLAVLVVSGLSMDATQENEIPALLEFTNDFSAEDEMPALLNLANDVSEEAKRGGGDVLHHLHCLELHKAGYCKYGLIRNRFCKKTCSCSDVLAQGCCKTLKDKNECASAWGMKYCHETCHKCFLCNIEPLGMQSKAIPDARITASSMWDGNHAPAQGRLNYKPPRGKAGSWSSKHNRVGQWIQVDLNRVTKVTGIATQGRSDTNQWVKQYKLQYSSDGKTFNNYEGVKVFTANKDRNSVVKHNLYKPIIARLLTTKTVC
ncbi:hypothetical protein QZH41_006604 [Actinostola sp. cb2023]|nr:hypothetical protein QZH41_006604 [Actinostola sp. cb2023]